MDNSQTCTITGVAYAQLLDITHTLSLSILRPSLFCFLLIFDANIQTDCLSTCQFDIDFIREKGRNEKCATDAHIVNWSYDLTSRSKVHYHGYQATSSSIPFFILL